MTWSPWTCGLQPQCQEPQDGFFSGSHQFWVCSFLLATSSLQHHPVQIPPLCGDPSQWGAHTTVVSTANWHLPNNGRPSTTTSNLRPSAALGSARSKSRTMMLVTTLPPASLQTLAVALSSANTRRPNTPACAHDARWWPNLSSWRLHWHVCNDRGKGSRRRL